MKNILFAYLFLFIGASITAQTASFEWAKNTSGTDYEQFNAITADFDGNLYTAGIFTDNTPNDTLTNTNNTADDAYIASYKTDGSLRWQKKLGGVGYEQATDIVATDNAIYICGSYTDTLTIDNTSIFTADTTNIYDTDIFIAKLDLNGNLVWISTAGSPKDDIATAIDIDGNNLYIVGSFKDTLNMQNNTLVSAGGKDALLINLNTDGSLKWLKGFGSSGTEQFNDVSIVPSSNEIYVGGYFNTTITMDNTTLTSNGDYDALLANITSNGTVNFAKNYGATNAEFISSLSYVYGNIALAGSFQTQTTLNNTTFNSNGGYDIFVLRTDLVGNIIWAKHAGGSKTDIVNQVNNKTGNVYICGNFAETCFFDTLTLLGNSLESNAYIAKYNFDGTLLWSKTINSTEYSEANAIWIDNDDNQFIAGAFSNTMLIANDTLNAHNFDAFISKSFNCTPINAPQILPIAPVCAGQPLTLLANPINEGNYQWRGPFHFNSNQQNPTISSTTLNNKGLYYLQTNIDGCVSATDSLTINVFSIPDFSFIGVTDANPADTLAYNTTNTDTASTYLWTIDNGKLLSPPDSSGAKVAWSATEINGKLCLTITNTNNCSYTLCSTIDLTKTNITQTNIQNLIKIQPNPAKNTAIITLPKHINNTATLQIYNNLGQIIFSQNNLKNNVILLNCVNLASGLYIIQASANGINHHQKLIIQH